MTFALRLDPADEAADRALVLAGRSLLAARADDALAALGWLAAHPRVRADQVGLYGAGEGGPVALHAALLHTEPVPVVVAGHLGSYATSTPAPGSSLPGVLRQVDLPDLYAALLPRPLLVQSEPGGDARAATDAIALAYKSAEADDAFAAGAVDTAAAVDFLSRWLTAPRPTPVVPPLRVRFDVPARLEIADRVDQVLASGMLTQGQVVLEFERVASRWTGFPALAVSTGSSALDIAYNLVGVAGRTVLVPVNTFFATASSAVRAGATVDFVDIELDGFGLDPDALAEALDRHDDVAAVTVVHIGGVVSPSVQAVRDQCAARGIPLIEDSAHSLGSRLGGELSGTFGRMSTFSLHPAKVATSGEGGLIGLSDEDDFLQAQLWRDHGKVSIDRNVHDRLGTNWRLSEVHASVGIAHLGQLDAMLAERRAAGCLLRRAPGLGAAGPPLPGAGRGGEQLLQVHGFPGPERQPARAEGAAQAQPRGVAGRRGLRRAAVRPAVLRGSVRRAHLRAGRLVHRAPHLPAGVPVDDHGRAAARAARSEDGAVMSFPSEGRSMHLRPDGVPVQPPGPPLTTRAATW